MRRRVVVAGTGVLCVLGVAAGVATTRASADVDHQHARTCAEVRTALATGTAADELAGLGTARARLEVAMGHVGYDPKLQALDRDVATAQGTLVASGVPLVSPGALAADCP